MSYETISYSKDGAVAQITLNRPAALNAVNRRMREELRDAISKVDGDDDIKVAILGANGPSFSSGQDLNEPLAESVSRLILSEYKPILSAITDSDTLFIARIQGVAAGISAALAMNCDLAIMADDASFYLAFANLGLVPDGGATWHLVRALGYKRALATIMQAQRISAPEALTYGLINRTCSSQSLEAETAEWAASLARRASLANSAAKRLARAALQQDWAETVSAEAREQASLVRSNDFQRALTAFKTKEKPVFKGD